MLFVLTTIGEEPEDGHVVHAWHLYVDTPTADDERAAEQAVAALFKADLLPGPASLIQFPLGLEPQADTLFHRRAPDHRPADLPGGSARSFAPVIVMQERG